jgi:hypothetical protein
MNMDDAALLLRFLRKLPGLGWLGDREEPILDALREMASARSSSPGAKKRAVTLVFVARDRKLLCVAFPTREEAVAYSSEVACFEGAFVVDRREVGGLDLSRVSEGGAEQHPSAPFVSARIEQHAARYAEVAVERMRRFGGPSSETAAYLSGLRDAAKIARGEEVALPSGEP